MKKKPKAPIIQNQIGIRKLQKKLARQPKDSKRFRSVSMSKDIHLCYHCTITKLAVNGCEFQKN
jgi:hypothetical protein